MNMLLDIICHLEVVVVLAPQMLADLKCIERVLINPRFAPQMLADNSQLQWAAILIT
jgi:hypothetical protein